jgi:hypothetical protein
MDHQEIPKLLTVLTESPFPVQIYHVEHKSYDFQKDRQVAPLVTAENEVDQKRFKLNQDRLNLAMNQVNLAEVLVAGTFILYNEPKTPGEQSAAPAAGPATAKAPQSGNLASGSPAATTGIKPGVPATSGPAAGSATKSPSPAKAVSPVAPSAPQSPKSTAPTSPATGSTSPKPGQPAKSKS